MLSRANTHACNFRISEGDRKRYFAWDQCGTNRGSCQKYSDLKQKKIEQNVCFQYIENDYPL